MNKGVVGMSGRKKGQKGVVGKSIRAGVTGKSRRKSLLIGRKE